MPPNDGTLVIYDARILFRNFAGKEDVYNREGDRNFCIALEPKIAEEMAADGWNIKTLKPREEGEEGTPYIQVSVGFKNRPPRLVMINSQGRRDIPQHLCDLFDWADFQQADVIIRPYRWGPINGKSGIKAYLKSLFVILAEDELEKKYSEVPYAEGLPGVQEPLQIGPGDDPNVIDGEFIEET